MGSPSNLVGVQMAARTAPCAGFAAVPHCPPQPAVPIRQVASPPRPGSHSPYIASSVVASQTQQLQAPQQGSAVFQGQAAMNKGQVIAAAYRLLPRRLLQ